MKYGVFSNDVAYVKIRCIVDLCQSVRHSNFAIKHVSETRKKDLSFIIIIVNDKGPKPLTCQNKNNNKIQS